MEWISVDERLPEMGISVIAAVVNYRGNGPASILAEIDWRGEWIDLENPSNACVYSDLPGVIYWTPKPQWLSQA